MRCLSKLLLKEMEKWHRVRCLEYQKVKKKYFSFLLKIAAWEPLSFSKTSRLPRTKASVGKICGNSSAAFFTHVQDSPANLSNVLDVVVVKYVY